MSYHFNYKQYSLFLLKNYFDASLAHTTMIHLLLKTYSPVFVIFKYYYELQKINFKFKTKNHYNRYLLNN